MDVWKFDDMLAKSALYFARQDRFVDPFEGRFSDGNSTELSPSDGAFFEANPVSRSLAEAKAQHEIHRQCVFISCWHRNTKEAREMWEAYTSGPDSVVLVTFRVAQAVELRKALAHPNEPWRISQLLPKEDLKAFISWLTGFESELADYLALGNKLEE